MPRAVLRDGLAGNTMAMSGLTGSAPTRNKSNTAGKSRPPSACTNGNSKVTRLLTAVA
jgi:hypothetical protein